MNENMRHHLGVVVLLLAFASSMYLNREELKEWFELNFGPNATINATDRAYNPNYHRRTNNAATPAPVVKPTIPDPQAACKLEGNVTGCGCDYASVEYVIHQELQPVLRKLVQMPFFAHYKVNLYCDCEFWPDESMCFQEDCCVKECEEKEIPETWRKAEQDKLSSDSSDSSESIESLEAMSEEECEGGGSSGAGVDKAVGEGVAEKLAAIQSWNGLDNPWVPEDAAELKYSYVNLQLNPEKYTGYKGEDARRIWAAIYAQSVFEEPMRSLSGREGSTEGDQAVCEESRILYRLVSGMHSSITASIINNYYDEDTGEWGPNLPFFKARFGGPAAKPYIENMYFTFLFVLRAVMKIGPTLNHFDYNTGFPAEDKETYLLIDRLEANEVLLQVCPDPFNEAMLWKGSEAEAAEQVEKKLQVSFHNITRLIDCVGCEKCRMWAKLAIQGIATALKIVFALPKEDPAGVLGDVPQLKLERNEVISLINLLAKLADSVEVVRSLSLALDEQDAASA